jgi:hypothetical protein
MKRTGVLISRMDERNLLFAQGPTNTLSSVRSYFEGLTGDSVVRLHEWILDKQNCKPLAVPAAVSLASPRKSSLAPLASYPGLVVIYPLHPPPKLHQRAINKVQWQKELPPKVYWSFSNAPKVVLQEFWCRSNPGSKDPGSLQMIVNGCILGYLWAKRSKESSGWTEAPKTKVGGYWWEKNGSCWQPIIF